ncbi:MAG: hypothetical protein GX589_02075 [Deltaproteobacteria bacterium]|nr:hypothetical protein [Deltaproteobacteria bacterium]
MRERLLRFHRCYFYLLLALAAWVYLAPSSLACAETAPKVTVFAPNKVSPGVTLVPLMREKIVLLSESGEVLNTWPIDATRARLLKDGTLLVLHASNWGRNIKKWRKLKRNIRIYDKDSKVLWEHVADDFVHHDIRETAAGGFIFLQRSFVPEEKKQGIKDLKRRAVARIRSDAVVEIDRQGNTLFEWPFWESIDLNYCGSDPCRPDDWTHANTVAPLPPNKWYDQGHTAFKPGNIMVMPRSFSTILIIDRESKKIVWEYSGDYKGGLDKSHEPHMIPPHLPGGGNVLVFDNGTFKHPKESYILEINPLTKEIVWKYDRGEKFFSKTRGAVQRLPNGNTLISEDNRGRCFEITPAGEMVWLFEDDYEINRCERFPSNYFKKEVSPPANR